jgi:hypothetical protein
MAETPNLTFTLLGESEVNSEAAYNENLIRLALFAGPLWIQDRDLSAPPGGETSGYAWLVSGTGTGDWADHDGELAGYYEDDAGNPVWYFQALHPGMIAYVEDEAVTLLWDGSAWLTVDAT